MTKKDGGSCPFWLTQAMLLHREDKLDSEPVILELPAENKGGPNFELLQSWKPVVACDNQCFSNPPLYMPTHNACIIVAKRVILLRRDNSLRRLWLVIENRFHNCSRLGDERYLAPICRIGPPNGWPGVGKYQGMQWDPSESSDDDALATFPK